MRALPYFYRFLVLCTSLAGTASSETLDRIVAVVGDSVILSSELDAYVLLKLSRTGTQPDSLTTNLMRHQLLDDLIEGRVLLVHAERDTNITVSAHEIEDELSSRISHILRTNGINTDEFETLLRREQGIGLTEFKKQVRQQIRQELLKRKVEELYVARYPLSRSDVRAFYDEYSDSLPPLGQSILVSKLTISKPVSDSVKEVAYAKILSLQERLRNGADFAELAVQFSEGPNASRGGDLGFISKGTLTELAFEEMVFSISPGQISDPFETRLGFHIVTLLARRDQQVHVRQIFIRVSPPEKQLQRTLSLLDSIRAHASSAELFAAAVEAHGIHDATSGRDGRANWLALATLDPAIRSAFDTLAAGQISKPVDEEKSLALYRINELLGSRRLTLEDDWSKVAHIARRVCMQTRLRDLVVKWREQTFIDIRL